MYTVKDNTLKIIGVDAGYGNIKTANTIFATGIVAYDHEPLFSGNIMEYEGKWYRIGEGHKAFNPDKTCDEDFRLLTYAAIAAELAHHHLNQADVQLAAGLPLTWTARHRETFRSYLMENRDICLRFNDVDYHFTLVGCNVFPQGYSALVSLIYYDSSKFTGTTVMADIGNGTMDTLFLVNGKPDENRCFTEELGVKQCVAAIRKELSNRYALNAEEHVIQQVLLTGTADLEQPYLDLITGIARRYVTGIFDTLHSFEFLAYGLTWGEKRELR